MRPVIWLATTAPNTSEPNAAKTCSLDEAVEYQRRVLPDVSRTFALTIPELPQPLDTIVGNAYLWCRIADTIEDEPNLAVDTKHQLHERLIDVTAGDYPAADWAREASAVLTEATVPAERALVRDPLPACRKVTRDLPGAYRVAEG